MTWEKLKGNDCHEWKLNVQKWKTSMKSSTHAASQLPGKCGHNAPRIYDRHKKKQCTCIKINYKKHIPVRSYYEILINAKSLQFFVDAVCYKFLSHSSSLSLEFKYIKYIINSRYIYVLILIP